MENTTKDKATARPWKIITKDNVVDIVGTQAVDEILARCHSSFIGAKGLAEGKANASLVVKAVNEYDSLKASNEALLEALNQAVEALHGFGSEDVRYFENIIKKASK
jgi:hypothetical protein